MSSQLRVEASARQGFGIGFTSSSKDQALAREILHGTLRMSPHPPWRLPDEIDWDADPFSDRNWRAQFHMLRWLDPLRRRAEKGDTASADAWLMYAESWVGQHRQPGPRSSIAWMDMVDGIRALELCLAVNFVSEARPGALTWLSEAIEAHAQWLSDAGNLGHSNHALHQHQGLLVCGLVLGDEEATSLATSRLAELFTTAYDAQGINAEGALAYHLANYNWWSIARRRLEVEELHMPESFSVLDKAPYELAHATKPDGNLATIGDTDVISARTVRHPATTWVTSGGADGEPPEELISQYSAGYLFARSGWGDHERAFEDETFWSLSYGAADRVHGHVDGGSITFSSMGHEWITDPGKYQYGSSTMRDFCLSRTAHSLPYVVGGAYDKRSVVECTRSITDSAVYDVTVEDRGYEGVIIDRRIVYSVTGEYAVVIDRVQSKSECTVVQNWQCGRGTSAQMTKSGFTLTAGDKRAAVLFTGTQPLMSVTEGADDPLAGWVSTGWKTREPAPALTFTKSGTRFRFVTLIAAGFRGAEPSMELVPNAPAGELRLRIDTGRVAEQIIIGRESASIVGHSLEDAAPVVLQRNPDAPPLDPLDTATRRDVLKEIHRARNAGWEAPDIDSRARAATHLRDVLKSFNTSSGIDLGLEASISDLEVSSNIGLSRLEVRKRRPGLINWSGDPGFNTGVSPGRTITVTGSSAALPELQGDALVTHDLGSLVLPVLVVPAPGDTLTVMFHGAVDRARTHLPLFQRVRFQKELGAGPVAAFADPTLDLSAELRLGWYLGSEDVDLPQSIATSIHSIAATTGATKIVLQGGSGGGFAALQVGALIPGSHVIAMNPQTDLRQYTPKFYRQAMSAAFGIDGAVVPQDLIPRINVMERLARHAPRMSITLVMNTGDVTHVRNHGDPLRRSAAKYSDVDFHHVSIDLGPGHRAPDNDIYRSIMGEVYDRIGTVLA